jgi:hypothetical protein
MEPEAWPTPQGPSREPLPRLDDLPVAEQGYEQESVKAAFDSFYRHAAQLDAALRTLEAVDSFHRHAAALRTDLRSLRASGWTQQSWTAPPSYGYGMRAPREGIPPAVWRIGGEVAFLVAVAVALGVAKLSWWVVLLAMAGAFAIVCLIEWLAAREQFSFAQPAAQATVHPVVEAQRVEETDEHDSLGWTAFEEAQEPSDAMTIIGVAPLEEEDDLPDRAAEPLAEPEPEPRTEAEVDPDAEPEPEPEPDLPPAAESEVASEHDGARRWWRRHQDQADSEPPAHAPGLPRHVRVLPAEEASLESDPWEEGFDDPAVAEADEFGEAHEEADEPLVLEDSGRRRFRRR